MIPIKSPNRMFTCSQPLKLNPSDCNLTFCEIFACALADSIIAAIRRATSGIPLTQWFVLGPVTFEIIEPNLSHITAFE